MDDSVIIEKILGTYFITISFLDSIVVWPAGYFIVKSYLPDNNSLQIALLTGIFFAMYSLGKLISLRSVSYLSCKIPLNILLTLLLVISSIGALLIGVFPGFYTLFFARFLAGVGSNVQLLIRKLFFNVCAEERDNWPELAIKLFWASKIGAGFGVFFAGALSSSTLLSTPKDSSAERWFMLSLVLFMLYVSGLLVVLYIQRGPFVENRSENYAEMQEKRCSNEIHNEKLEIQGESGENATDRLEFRRFVETEPEGLEEREMQRKVLDESEEQQQFSPSHMANQSSFFKIPLRPTLDLISSKTETIEEPQACSEFKKTHISFIESEQQNYPEPENTDVKTEEFKINDDILCPSVRLASFYRIYLTFVVTLVLESLPYTLLFTYNTLTILQLSLILGSANLLSSLQKIFLTAALIRKFSYLTISSFFTVTLIISLIIQGANVFFEPFVYLNLFTFIAIIHSCEMILPVGCIMIADSVSYLERERTLERNNFYCLMSKVFGTVLTPLIMFFIHPALLYGFCVVFLFALVGFTRCLATKFKYLVKAPYFL